MSDLVSGGELCVFLALLGAAAPAMAIVPTIPDIWPQNGAVR
jgi:hypothetical protein